jgi:hypothetical protein
MKGYQSTMSELARLIGRRELTTLEATCKDQREIFQVAAHSQHMSDTELCMKLADKIGLPVLTRLSDDFKFVQVPGFPFEECLSKAFVFFQAKNGLFGIACIEPAWLNELRQRFEQLPILLTTWAIVKSWVYQDCESSKDFLRSKTVSQTFRSQSSVETAFEAVISTIARLGVSATALDFLSDKIQYEVIAPDLNTYYGEIKTSQSSQVEQLLSLSLLEPLRVIKRTIDGVMISIFVSPNVRPHRFYIQWTPDLPKTADLNARLLLG